MSLTLITLATFLIVTAIAFSLGRTVAGESAVGTVLSKQSA